MSPCDRNIGRFERAIFLTLVAMAAQAIAGESTGQDSSRAAEQLSVSSLPTVQGRTAQVVESMDLTIPFHTRTAWEFVAATLPGTHFSAPDDAPRDGGALAQCFVNKSKPHCTYGKPKTDDDWFSTPMDLDSADVVFLGPNNTLPLLMIKTGSDPGVDGSHTISTELFAYNRESDSFQSIFSNGTGSNNNQRTIFIKDGPLRGDVIVDEPSGAYYWVEVYRSGRSGRYASILGYRGHTVYGDGNPLSVADSEMPEILRRLGLWHKGDALPVPHEGCKPVMRHQEEWCQ